MARGNKNYEQLAQENGLLREFLSLYSSHRVDCARMTVAPDQVAHTACTCHYFERAVALDIALRDPAEAAALRQQLERDAQAVTR